MIGEWFFQEYWHSKRLPNDDISFEYVRALMNLAGADGVLADEERKWILGNSAAKGVNENALNYFKTYQPTKADLEAMIKEKPKFTQQASRPLIFEAFLAASADNDLHAAEREAIYRMGRAMGIEDTVVQQLEKAAENERSHRNQVVALAFPEGMKKACDVAEADYKSN
ncbi:unnamed protein product [Rotaria socialis]|uniref:Co-chaperone DjlA N-terminal domain-containing protein n=1 Tax=Rotaria socialis TaxID=392032 RepID=A0A818MTU0_9BILA|nr:unnamed protein product [Rotaria socialis]CAF4697488.1 unnamed protein product [Rotaria socialis]